MFEAFRRFFDANLAPREEDGADLERRLAVATSALLLEAAQADEEFSPAERDFVTAIIKERFSIAGPALDELLALAEDRRRRSTGLYEFTRLISDHYDHAGKLAVLELLWRVVYRDGRLEAREDALLHKLAQLLDLPHGDLIALKLRVKGGSGPAPGGPPSGAPAA